MENLIYDRTANDVEIALYNSNSKEHLKGCYNYTDLNRVEEWCEYIYKQLKNYGYKENIIVKKNWTMTDFPTRKEIDRIRNNINALKKYCVALTTPEEIIFDNTMDYEKANTLEKILYVLNEYIGDITMKTNFNIGVASTLIEQEYLFLNVE